MKFLKFKPKSNQKYQNQTIKTLIISGLIMLILSFLVIVSGFITAFISKNPSVFLLFTLSLVFLSISIMLFYLAYINKKIVKQQIEKLEKQNLFIKNNEFKQLKESIELELDLYKNIENPKPEKNKEKNASQ